MGSRRFPVRLFGAAIISLASIGAAASECGAPATPISQIQGTGSQSPLSGKTVTVEGILTLDARMPGGWRGFYLQQADHQTDRNPATSEAVFVYTRHQAGHAGDRLRMTAKVKEHHGLTELVGVKRLTICGHERLPEPITVSLPWPRPPESLENMRIRLDQPLVVVDSYHLGRYGTLSLANQDGVIATELHRPGQTQRNKRSDRLVLDDVRSRENPDPIPWPPGGLSAHRTVRAGDQVSGLSGILDFRFGDWRLQPDATPVFEAANPRQSPPPRPETPHVRVLTMNLGNFFNGNGRGGGFPAARGAHSPEDFEEQRNRLIRALTLPDPDILSLAELENDGYGPDSSINQLAKALGSAWRVVETPGKDGSDAIRTGLLYRADRVTAVGKPLRLSSKVFSGRGRPPISQIFQRNGGEARVQVVSVHFKSKGCRSARGADQDQGDGQGCYTSRRTQEAESLLHWLESGSKQQNDTGILVTGDLNAYAMEDPLQRFYQQGYKSTVHAFTPCNTDGCPHYTFRFRGERGTLDYALASANLQPRILGAYTWLINADEPPVLGYQSNLNTDTPIPWRSSDHNPVITDVQL